MSRNPLDAQIYTRGKDGALFGYIKQYPAAAASADDLKTLISRLKKALSEVIVYENYNLIYSQIEEEA